MDCQTIRDDLPLWATGDLGEAESARVEAHLASCRRCRDAAEEYRRTVAALRDAAPPTAVRAQALARLRVAAGAEIRSARRRTWARRGLRLAIGLAATVVLGAMIGYLVRGVGLGDGGLDPLRERWRYEGGRTERTSPAEGVVVRGRLLYLVRRNETGGAVVAVDTAAGEPVWESRLPAVGYLAADEGRIYCVANAARHGLELVALDASDGRMLWRFGGSGRGVALRPSRPVALPGGRVAWTVGSTVHLVDAATGAGLWSRSVPGEGPLSEAAATDDGVLVASCRALYGLKASTGEPAWRAALAHRLAPTVPPLLAVAGPRVYVAGGGSGQGGRLVCLDDRGRRVLWSRDVPLPRHLVATMDGVYLRGTDVRALDQASGEAVWTCRADGCGPLTCEHGLVQFVDSARDGRLVAIDERTGQTAWAIAGLQSCGVFQTAGGTGFVKTWDGVVHAVALGRR